jgi:probable phosphoglycerate mutase
VVTTVYLVRHGEAEGNVLPYFQGTCDTALTERGRKQVGYLAERFRDIPLDAVYYSPWVRAKETAEAVNLHHGLPLIPEYDLHEIDGGDWEGVPVVELCEKFPVEFEVWQHHIWDFQAPNGEKMTDVFRRMADVMTKIARENPGKTVAVCSHGCAIRNFLCYAEFGEITRLNDVGWADNTAVSCAEYDTETGWHLRFKNSASHLPDDMHAAPNPAWKPDEEENA